MLCAVTVVQYYGRFSLLLLMNCDRDVGSLIERGARGSEGAKMIAREQGGGGQTQISAKIDIFFDRRNK